jgi:hypothetical protein
LVLPPSSEIQEVPEEPPGRQYIITCGYQVFVDRFAVVALVVDPVPSSAGLPLLPCHRTWQLLLLLKLVPWLNINNASVLLSVNPLDSRYSENVTVNGVELDSSGVNPADWRYVAVVPLLTCRQCGPCGNNVEPGHVVMENAPPVPRVSLPQMMLHPVYW